MVLQVIGPLAAAGASVFGMSQQSKAQNLANAIQWRAVQEQARANRKQEQLQRATRTDAYGNAVEYVPGQGFVTRTTPITRSILGAEQREQYNNLTVDAPQQREARRRMDRRSRMGDDAFRDEFARMRYQRTPNRSENEARALTDALMARNEKMRSASSGEEGKQLANALMRLGGSGSARSIAEALRTRGSDIPTVSETISDARRLGREDYRQDVSSRGALLDQLNALRGMADASPEVGINSTTYNRELTDRQEGAIQSLSDVIGTGGQRLSSVLGQTAQMAARNYPDVSGLASALGRINLGSGSSQPRQDPNLAFQQGLAQDAWRASLRGMEPSQALNAFRTVRGGF